MRKTLLRIALSLLLVLGSVSGGFAAGGQTRTSLVEFSAVHEDEASELKLWSGLEGQRPVDFELRAEEEVLFRAVTLKNGSSLIEAWKVNGELVAADKATILNDLTGSYEAELTFRAPLVANDTLFEVNYAISQQAGRSRNVWEGAGNALILVKAPIHEESDRRLVELRFKDVEFIAEYTNGQAFFKYAIYISFELVYDDGASVLRREKKGNIDPGQVRNINVSYSESYEDGSVVTKSFTRTVIGPESPEVD